MEIGLDEVVRQLIAAAEGREWSVLAGWIALAVVGLVRAATGGRLPELAERWVSACSAVAAAVGVALAAGAVWWHALILGFVAGSAARGFWSLVGEAVSRLARRGAGAAGVLLLVLLVLPSWACPIEVGPEDRGLRLVVGESGELVELHPAAFPLRYEAEPEVATQALAAALWMNAEASRDRPCDVEGVVGCRCLHEWFLEADAEHPARVQVVQGIVDPEEPAFAELDYDGQGAILFATVYIEADYTEAHHVRHELGHCLGLEDDDRSLDLASIMSSPTTPFGVVTDADFAAVERWRL